MSHDAVMALLVAGCICQVICVGGTLWARSGFDQLHFAGAASTLGLVFFAAAAVVQGMDSVSGTIDCVAALALTFVLAPVLVTATARAGRRMRFDTLEPLHQEFEQQP